MIKPCTSPQHPGWLELRQALWPHHEASVLLDEMSRFCAEPQRFGQFIADDGAPLGFIEIARRSDYVNGTRSSPVAFLEGIYVAPFARKRGVAKVLVQAAEVWARERGCVEFASDAAIDNQISHAMHRALGFAETQRVVFFRKVLAAD
jgi:aminoglycoside 6'-N-acetyltransferase I